MISSALLFLAIQSPQAPGSDVIRLDVGTEIEGTIVQETEDYVEIVLGEGMVVGFEKARAVAIIRSATAPAGDRRAVAATAGQSTREQWFALHDGEGRSIGWLQETVGRDAEGRARFSEEWRFGTGDSATEITVLETLDADDRPQSCFYRERVRDLSDRIVSERVVRGVVHEGRFEVSRMTLTDSTSRTYAFADGARFPLELRASLRRVVDRRAEEFDVYDPRCEEWVRERFEVGAMRTVEHKGARVHVRLLREHSSRGDNTEWLDGASACIRREIAGPALVAVPMSADRAIELSRQVTPSFEPALAVEGGERFAMWLPNPLWIVDAERHGEITARSDVMSATMSLVLLDQLGSDVVLDAAVDTVERWLRLAHPDIEFSPRRVVRLRDADAVRMRGTYEVRRPGESVRRTCEIVVFEAHGVGVLSFCGDAPAAMFTEVERDFETALRRVEPRREGFAPELRGPLGLSNGRPPRVR